MRKLVLISLFIFGLCILFTPRLPFMDYPDWVYQGNIFHGILSSDPLFVDGYRIVSPFVPNSVVTVFIGLLSFVVAPDFAGRILVLISVLIMFLGLRGLFEDKNEILGESLALIFTPSVFLFIGLISFYLGLGLLFLFISRFKKSQSHITTIIKYAIFLVVLYYIHFMPFFIACLWLLVKSVFYKDKDSLQISELIPGFLITGILALLYMKSASADPSGSTIWAYRPFNKITSFFKALSIFYTFNDTSKLPTLLSIIILNMIWVISLLLFLYKWVRGHLYEILKNQKFTYGVGCLIMGLGMPLLINGFGYNSELRFYWIGFVFIAGAILTIPRIISNKMTRIIVLVAIGTIIWRSTLIIYKGIEYGEFEKKLSSAIQNDDSFQLVMISFDYPEYYPFRPGIQKRIAVLCEQIMDINRVPLFLKLERHMIYRGIFKTGIIRSKYPPYDIKALLVDSNATIGDECSKLLFICPRGFTQSFRDILTKRFFIIREESNFIIASPLISQPIHK